MRVVFLFFISFCFGLALCQVDPERQLAWTVNPGCPNASKWDCNQTLLVHVTAKGENNTVNLLWAFYSKPSLLLSVTEPGAELQVNWDTLGNSSKPSVRFDSTPEYSFGLVFDKVIEFYDPEDNANLTLSNKSISMDCEKFNWSMSSIDLQGGALVVQMLGSNYDNGAHSGNVSLTLSAYGKDGYGPQLPHLQHSANSSQVEIILDNMQSSKDFEGKSRFGLQLLLVDSVSGQGPDQVDEKRSLDDEHTPGVFTVDELLTPNVKQAEPGGYLQWRPVAYTSSVRNIEASTTTVHYPLKNLSQANLKGSLLHDFFGHRLAHQLIPQALNVTFGESEDGFYNSVNYNAWSFTMAYGLPPKEKFSLLVVLVLSIGLGIPAALLVFGGLYVACKKCCAKKDEPLLN